jgi:hypothetical protein
MKLSNTSGYEVVSWKPENENKRDPKLFLRQSAKKAFLLTSLACLLLLSSCAAPRIAERPSHRGVSLEDALSQYRRITSINTVVGLEYEKNDSIMSGDAAILVSPDKLSLRVYYLGFLQGEVYEDNGKIKSKPKLDKNKSLILVDGLKNSLFWWNISDYRVSETADTYELRNDYRRVVVSKDSLLPIEQTIELDNGDTLAISYEAPSRIVSEDGTVTTDNSPLAWYQSRVKIQLRRYVVRINVKSYSFTR